MKYQKLHKFNAKQDKRSFCWPENDNNEQRSRDMINRNDENESSNSSRKVRSLMKAMNRVLSTGEKQKQSPRTPNFAATKNSGFDHQEEDLDDKFKN